MATKGITIAFRGDTTNLDKAIRQLNKEANSVDSELKKVNNALKFNPKSTELLANKQTLLKQKIENTEKSLAEFKAAQAQLDDDPSVDKTSQDYMALQRNIIEAESKLKHFNAEAKKVEAAASPMGQFSSSMKNVGTSLTNAGQAMKGFSIAGAAVVGMLGTLSVKTGQWADDLNTMSKVYSLNTEDLQMYSLAARQVDVDVDTIAKSHVKLEKNMLSASQGSKNQAEAFEKLGVAYQNADGSLRDGDAVWQDTIKALGQMENETERDAYAMQLMGKSAAELNPLIEDGGETYQRVSEMMSKYGLDYIDQDTLDKANQFNDSLDDIRSVGLLTFQTLGAELAGYLAPAMEKVAELVGRFANWLSQLDPRVLTVVGGIAALVAVVAPLLMGLGQIAFAISSITGLMATMGVTMGGLLTSVLPIIAAIAAVVAVFILAYKHSETFRNAVHELGEAITAVLAAAIEFIRPILAALLPIFEKLWGVIKAVAKVVGTVLAPPLRVIAKILRAVGAAIMWVKDKFEAIQKKMESLGFSFDTVSKKIRSAGEKIREVGKKIAAPFIAARDIAEKAFEKINALFPIKLGKIFSGVKLPHFKISGGEAPWGIMGKGTRPSVDIEWYKKGGIFNSPSVIGVGEAGPEAVLPLDKLFKHMDNMSTGTTQNININIDGAKDPMQVAEEIVRALQREMRTA